MRKMLPSWATRRRVGLGVVLAILVLLLLVVNLVTQNRPLNSTETANLYTDRSWHLILANPLDLPLKSLQRLSHYGPSMDALLLGRLPSAVLAALALILFAYVLNHWYSSRSTIIGIVILACSAWFLHISHFAGTDIEYLFATILLIAVQTLLNSSKRKYLAFYAWLLANLLLFFVPGFIWLIALNSLWQWHSIKSAWKTMNSIPKIIWLTFAIAGIGFLAFSLTKHDILIKSWLGLPMQIPEWMSIVKNLGVNFGAAVYHAPYNPQLWLARLPILDYFLSLMLIAGIFFFARFWKASRSRLLLTYFTLGTILVSLNGPVKLSVIVPIIYLVVTAGIVYLLQLWLSVFPRNPLARRLGFVLIVLTISLSCFYNLMQYFVAWPNNSDVISSQKF